MPSTQINDRSDWLIHPSALRVDEVVWRTRSDTCAAEIMAAAQLLDALELPAEDDDLLGAVEMLQASWDASRAAIPSAYCAEADLSRHWSRAPPAMRGCCELRNARKGRRTARSTTVACRPLSTEVVSVGRPLNFRPI